MLEHKYVVVVSEMSKTEKNSKGSGSVANKPNLSSKS